MGINKSIRSGIVLTFISMFVFVTVMASPVYAETALPEGSAQEEETVLTDPAESNDKEEETTEPEAEVKSEEPALAGAAEAEATIEAEETAPAEAAEEVAVAQEEDSGLDAVQAPLVFEASTASTSGSGWTWTNDNSEKTLTLDGMKLDLTKYTDKYAAAITLPAGSTVDVQGDSGIGLVGKSAEKAHIAVYADGDLTIKGNKTLLIDAEQSATGIKAGGNIRIGEGKNPQNGLQLVIKTTGLAVKAGGTLTVKSSDLLLDIVDTNGTYTDTDYNGAMIIDGADVAADAYAVDIQDSVIDIENQNDATGKLSYGIYAGRGSVRMKYSDYRQMGDKESSYYGIRACDGSVDIISTDVEMQIWTFGDTGNNTKLISAESAGSIAISDSEVKGQGDGTGLHADGGIGIDSGSDIDVAAKVHALETGGAGLSISGSFAQFINETDNSDAVSSTGAVTVTASEVYVSAKGGGSTGLKTTSTVNISGDSYVDMEGKLAAIQMIETSESDPITLTGVEVREGGTLQHVSGSSYIYSYSEGTLDQALNNASKQVVISERGRLVFLEQPEDEVVAYPGGAAFEVRMSRTDKVASYQWYARDYVGNEFELTGQSATTPRLIIPSTDQRNNRLTYYCVVTDKAGNKLVSKEAYLDANNKYSNKTVLYVGEFAVNPGESLNLAKDTNPKIGSGTISLSSDGRTIVMDNVKLNNSNSMYDGRLSPSKGIRLARNQSTDTSTDVEYKVILKGANEIVNSFESDNGNGYTVDFMLFGGEEKGKSPTVIIDGESRGGTLRLKGGTAAMRAIANLIINADITVKPLREGDTSYLDGLITDTSGIKKHDMTIGANHKLDFKTYGAGLDSSGSLTVGENAEINIDMTMPHLVGGDSAGAQATEKGAVKVGDDKLELKPNTKMNISCVSDPDIMTNVAGCYGLWLKGAGLKADSSAISINMSAKPYEDPEYVAQMSGITAHTYVNMKNSNLTISIDADKWVGTAYGVLAQTNVTMDSCKADIAAAASRESFGLAANADQKLTSSQIDVVTKYVTNTDISCSYGILGSNMNLDVSKDGSHIKANTTNANGIAFIATTGTTGNTPKTYDPSYKAKMIKGSYDVVQPQNAAISIASIPGGQHPYVDLETFYDTKDTSKPAGSVELAKIQPAPPVTSVTIDSKTVSAASIRKAVEAAGGNSDTITSFVLGKNVRKISKSAFRDFKNVRTLVVKTKKLKKSTVKKSLKGSKVSKVKVKVGKKKTNKKYVKKYKKIFTKKNAGRKVKVTL